MTVPVPCLVFKTVGESWVVGAGIPIQIQRSGPAFNAVAVMLDALIG
jgi:hypothetical protein